MLKKYGNIFTKHNKITVILLLVLCFLLFALYISAIYKVDTIKNKPNPETQIDYSLCCDTTIINPDFCGEDALYDEFGNIVKYHDYDLNKDGEVDLKDLLVLQKYLIEKE